MSEQLDALAMQADGIDAEVAATAPAAMMAQQQQQQEIEQQQQIEGANVGQVKMIMALALPLLGTLYPSLNGIYTPQAQEAIAQSLGPVLTKYDISLSDWGSKYQEEIGALMVCGPIAWATVQGIKADIAERAKKGAQPAALPQEPAAPKDAASAEPVRLG